MSAAVGPCTTLPEDCKVTTDGGSEIECELESNGRYACDCDSGASFTSDDFCALDADAQDDVADDECFVPGEDCGSDADCDDGEDCVDGSCELPDCDELEPGDTCQVDADCGRDFICEDNNCFADCQ